MSSCDEYTLEFFVKDSFFGNILDEQLEKIVRLLEPERKRIENNMMDDYDEETMSWRSFRNTMWDSIDPIYEKRIGIIMGKEVTFHK